MATCTSGAWAHEFWIRPSTFVPAAGETARLRVLVGDRGNVDEIIRSSTHALRFEVIQPGRPASRVPGQEGRMPAGSYRFDRPGVFSVVYESASSFLSLPADRFEGYLVDEGLDDVMAERARRGESLAPGRESFSRYAKALVRVADGPINGFDQAIGMLVEIVLETSPFGWQPGDRLTFRVLYEGLPLADEQVKLIHLDSPDLRVLSRTDRDGRVDLLPPRGGPWMAAAVYMRRAPAHGEVDWEGLWANLSFALPEATLATAASPAGP